MIIPEKICPDSLKSKALFEQKDWSFEDNHLKTRTETYAFKAKYNLQTTPLIFIDG
ncbi:MAG: glutaredoxin [Francisella endosymbiont of Hyalomma asiaticum]